MRVARTIPKVYVKSRHSSECKYKGKPKRLGCACPKQLLWSKDGKEYRESAETCDGEVAERKAREKEQEFERIAALPVEEQFAAQAKTIRDVAELFIAKTKTENQGVTEKHINKIRSTFTALAEYCEAEGVTKITDVTLELLEAHRNEWEYTAETARKRQGRIVSLFHYAHARDYIEKNPATGLGKIKGSDHKQTIALDDKQFEQLLSAVPKLNGSTTDEVRGKVRNIMLLQRWTGLAIRDAVLFERGRLKKDADGFYHVFLRREKTGNAVNCTLSAEIAEVLLAQENSNPRYLFVSERPDDERERDNLIAVWATRCRTVGKLAELKDDHGNPVHFHTHVLRDTFAVWALNSGVPVEDVAALLGDSVQVVIKHYMPWVKSRAERLSQRMKAALAGGVSSENAA